MQSPFPVLCFLVAILLPLPEISAEQSSEKPFFDKPVYQHGISLLHELKYPEDFTHFEYANPDAPKGGRIVLASESRVGNLSGYRSSELPSAPGLGQTYDRLFVRTGDELSAFYGWLANGVALSSDNKSLYVRLHPAARWHDDVPITTEDIQFTYKEVLQSVFGQASLAPWIEELEITGTREFIVHHRDEFTPSNIQALMAFRVRPAHYWKDRDPTKATLIPPIASGPYKIKDFDRDYIVYERVKDYWGRDIPINRGRFNFEEIRYDVYRDTTVAREGFRKGLFDVHFESNMGQWFSAYDIPALEQGWIKKDTRTVTKFIGMQSAIALNTRREQLSDIRVREALTVALDFEWQNRVFHYDSRVRARSYFSGSQFAITGTPNGEELALLNRFRDQLDPRIFTHPFTIPASPGMGLHRQGLERAQSLLAEAGWSIKEGQLMNANSEQFTLDLLTQNPANQRMLLPYVETLKLLGIDARLRLVDSVVAINLLRERDYDAYVRGHDFLNPPGAELRGAFSSQTAEIQMSYNMAGIRNPIIDALIEEVERATNIETATSALKALDRVLLWGFYNIPLQAPEGERFLLWDKFGRPGRESVARYEYLVGSSLRVIDGWWFDLEKAAKLTIAGK